jgi:hypothetical protein
MSNSSALCSATFVDPGYDHLVELVHQRDRAAHRRLESLELELYEPGGACLGRMAVDPRQETLDLAALVAARAPGVKRVMVAFDARYDNRVFPYRPHHYAYLRRRNSTDAPLYYAVNATLGGVPDRIEAATRQNNFETYLFLSRPAGERYGLRLGNLARFSTVEAQVITYHDEARTVVPVTLAPHQHAQVELPLEREGGRLRRVELKTLFRLASYVTGRRADSGALVLFDHLFTYFK